MIPSIAQHAKNHGIVPNKKLGQNFLFDSSLCDKIARSAGNINGKEVLEIGPGPGGLTRSILSLSPSHLTVIEKDQRCTSLLEDIKTYYPQLNLIHADALKIKLSEISDKKLVIIANLPYNVGTELLFRWLDEIAHVSSMTLMLQKEVVDRICASHNTSSYGRLGVMCQIVADVKKMFDVGPEAFYPPPKVTSSIVHIVPKAEQPTKEIISAVRHITQLAFSGRRKMIKKPLQKLHPEIEKILIEVGIDPSCRAENVSVDEYVRLAERISAC